MVDALSPSSSRLLSSSQGCDCNDDRISPNERRSRQEHQAQWTRRRRRRCAHNFWFVLVAMNLSCLSSLSRNRSVSFAATASSMSAFQHHGGDQYRTSSIAKACGRFPPPVLIHGVVAPSYSSFKSFSAGILSLFQTRMMSSQDQSGDNNNINNYATSTTKERIMDGDDESYINISGYRRPKVNWFPGHIAKAERLLSETLKSVDVVIEVRDARAPKATAHPNVGSWSAGRPRVVVLTRLDAVTSISRECWRRAYAKLGADGERGKRVGSGGGLAVLGGDEKNRNAQWRKERRRFDGVDDDNDNNSGSDEQQPEDDNDVYGEGVEEVLFVDAKRGQGTHAITRAVYRAGRHVNERRNRRGLNDRPLRVGIIGFPNVGKSALINRLLGRRRAKTANTPGVTRSLQWIRVATDKSSASASGASNNNRSTRDGGGSNNNSGTIARGRKSGFELLDSPGIIPSDLIDQNDALILAACNSIGVGAYDNQAVAAYLCDRIQALVLMGKGSIAAPQWMMKCKERYGFDPIEPLSKQHIAARWGSDSIDGSADTWIAHASANQDRLPTGEDMLFIVADNTCRGDPENAARKILQDFRDGRMGPIALQLAPETEDDDGQSFVNVREDGMNDRVMSSPMDTKEDRLMRQKEEIEQRAKAAMEAANAKGIDLPPVMTGSVNRENASKTEVEDTRKPIESEVGKGLFDGW